ncbi:hypothetical protein GYW75_01090 [Gilliamella sp. ESL0232]|uniref:hypothetical protein n=1 Tax=Gilliamella sp. ESL0232 TaxID=2705037 RepID=UPI0015807C5B|nr:hypothetical protein [Gilliamella sp. ESL0232]NUE94991.1 hypothetical protein [Gilliamella sp. ESL0232]
MELNRNIYSLHNAVEIIKKEFNSEFTLDNLLDLAYNEEIEICYYLTKAIDENSNDKILLNFYYESIEAKNDLNNINGMDSLIVPENMIYHMVFSNYCGAFMFWADIDFTVPDHFFSVNLLSCSMPLKVPVSRIRQLINDLNHPVSVNQFAICKSDFIKTKLTSIDGVKFLNTLSITPTIEITIDNLSITANEIIEFIEKTKKCNPLFKVVSKSKNIILNQTRPGQKSHPLKDKVITIARDTKNYYLEKDIDLGLKAIATKIKKHNDFSNKGLPSPEQMAKWFVADGIGSSKKTKRYDFELVLKN